MLVFDRLPDWSFKDRRGADERLDRSRRPRQNTRRRQGASSERFFSNPSFSSGHDLVNHLNNRARKAERYRHTDNDFVSIEVWIALAHRSSRTPLKNGCLTFPSADFARYSISASISGSTQVPLCAMRLA